MSRILIADDQADVLNALNDDAFVMLLAERFFKTYLKFLAPEKQNIDRFAPIEFVTAPSLASRQYTRCRS